VGTVEEAIESFDGPTVVTIKFGGYLRGGTYVRSTGISPAQEALHRREGR
jgi:hypothetical protein